MRVLITGAAGFLGSHLASRFLTEGYEVVGVDNFITGSEQNIAALKEHDGFSFLNHDVSTPQSPVVSMQIGIPGARRSAVIADSLLYLGDDLATVDVIELQ